MSIANLTWSGLLPYEGGISSKTQYNRKRSQEVFEVDQTGKKHQVVSITHFLI